jgi:3-oxoadipate enol-lactonase
VSTLLVNVDIVNLRHANPATGNEAPRIEIPTSVGRISLSVEGTAERAVFLWPSLFSDLHLYDLVVPLLGSDWRIIRVDGPGFGASERPRPNTQPEHYADAVVELLDALGQKKTFFAGTSWGGQIGAHLACRHPKRIEALLMMNTPLEPSVGGHLMKLFLTRWFVSSAFFASGVARAFFAPATLRGAPEVVRAFTARFAGFEGRAAATTVATTLRAFPGGEGILPQITAPTTVLLGELDRLGSPESLERIPVPESRSSPVAGIWPPSKPRRRSRGPSTNSPAELKNERETSNAGCGKRGEADRRHRRDRQARRGCPPASCKCGIPCPRPHP